MYWTAGVKNAGGWYWSDGSRLIYDTWYPGHPSSRYHPERLRMGVFRPDGAMQQYDTIEKSLYLICEMQPGRLILLYPFNIDINTYIVYLCF